MTDFKFEPSDEHPTVAHLVWFDDLKFCGCGRPEEVLGHLRGAMRALKDQSALWRERSGPTWGEPEKEMQGRVTKALGGDQEYGPLYYMSAYLLDAAGLTEHGGSVPGWLSAKGEALLAFLEATPEDGWLPDFLEQADAK